MLFYSIFHRSGQRCTLTRVDWQTRDIKAYTSSRYSRMLSSQLLLHACQKWPQKWKGSVSKVFSDFPGHILEDCWRIINYLILYSCCRISESYFFYVSSNYIFFEKCLRSKWKFIFCRTYWLSQTLLGQGQLKEWWLENITIEVRTATK